MPWGGGQKKKKREREREPILKLQNRKRIFANHIFNKGLISRKNFHNSTPKKKKNPTEKWANDLNRHFSKVNM